MKIRLKVDITGGHDGKRWPGRGGVAEVADGVGARMCKSGLAEPVVDDEPVETAVAVAGDVEAAAPADAETAITDDPAEERPGLTTESGPVNRGGLVTAGWPNFNHSNQG